MAQRKWEHRALHKSEARSRTISDLISDYAYAVRIEPDGHTVVEWVTEAFRRLTGFTVQELEAAGGLVRVIHPEDLPPVLHRLAVLLAGQPGISEHRILTKGGAVRWLRDYSCPEWEASQHRVVRIIGAGQDITERKLAEAALRESETRYRDLFENANDMIITFTLEGIITRVNRGLEAALGWSRDELIGQHYSKLATPAALALADERTRRALAGENLPSIFAAEIVRKGGRVVPIEVRARFIRDPAGTPIGVQGICRDLSERKRMEEELQRQAQVSRGQTATLVHTIRALAPAPALDSFVGQVLTAIAQQLEASAATLWLYERDQDTPTLCLMYEDGRILSATELHELAVSHPPLVHESAVWQELVRTRRSLVVADVEHHPGLASHEALVAQGVKTLLLVPVVLADEAIGWVGLRNTTPRPYRPEEIELAEALSHQITLAVHLTRLTEHKQQAAVLEERNRLAREIHDSLAQGLTGIVLHTEAALRVLTADPHKAHARLEEARTLARTNLAEVRRSVMALRPQAVEWDDLPTALARFATHAAEEIQTRITFHLHGTVRALPAEVTHHLFRISQEAVHNASTHAHARTVTIVLSFGLWTVQLRVQDDGRGFDLRTPSVGAGFGLTSMRERAERIGGRFTLTSRPGQGTVVRVVVPYSRFVSARRTR